MNETTTRYGKMKFLLFTVSFFLAVAVSPVYAAPIVGGISFTDGFTTTGTTTSIVSQLTSVQVSTPELANSCSGAFGSTCVPNVGTFASNFTVGTTPVTMFTYNGFNFSVTSFGTVNRTGFGCNGTQCTDDLDFVAAHGTVSGNGFTPTLFTMTWTSQGTCNEVGSPSGTIGAGTCVAGAGSGLTASWSASISATGQPVTTPEPSSMLLFGAGLIGLAALSRRRVKKN